MKEIYITNKESGISMDEISKAMDELLSQYPNLKKVLIIPPDFTRCYSYAGEISQILYKKTCSRSRSSCNAGTWNSHGNGRRRKTKNVCRRDSE